MSQSCNGKKELDWKGELARTQRSERVCDPSYFTASAQPIYKCLEADEMFSVAVGPTEVGNEFCNATFFELG